MDIGMVGLGRMGANMAARLARGGHRVAGFDPGAAAQPAPGRPEHWDGEWDPTLPMVPSANIAGDPIAVINQVDGQS